MYKKINDLYKRACSGDEFAKGELVEVFKPLIISSIKKYYFNGREFEDSLQEGYEVILKGIDKFDQSRGVKFPGYIQTILRFHYLEKLKKQHNILSLDHPIGEKENMTLLDTLEDPVDIEEDYIEKERRSWVYDSFSILTDRQRQVIVLFYIDNLSIKEIADTLGITYRTVVNTKVKAIEKLRKIL